ncbi:hypothetical protein [Streptosporangium lutulentum]|uniref:Uncharacterized protein n=1 Tax=Streptosporangium lutulentum TaxID=1461250 RepID=A0ABT9Q9J6_9ACTN|nr:hypothetical protein [Streptosporangium lutulentum]MDP9843420.1 hypothetical protein [Streptosporangium lutulentum]
MTASSGPRSSTEIRDYLVGQLNMALRRPGMFGGEIALQLLLDHLVYTERQDEAWAKEQQAMESRGAFTSIGVTGAFRALLVPDAYEYGVASVYAEFVRARGWLEADRVLTADEYESMRQELSIWVAQDRVLSEVLETFGAPSVLFGGSNPLYGKTLGYLTEQVEEPMLFFHLWNGTAPDAESTWPPVYSEPVLLAVRCGTGPFRDTFTFTPEGKKRRPDAR